MAWQSDLQDFLADQVPATRGLRGAERLVAVRSFHAALTDAGLAAPGWPLEVGGLELGAADQISYHQIFTAAGAPPHPCGLSFIVAPTIIRHGTAEQKDRYLRPLLRADELWCQGFSEPGAGSDLTALSTRAVRDGEVYRVSGQKLWTTQADRADFMFTLVRTGPAGPNGAGITYLLIPMSAPGVTVRPLRDISGGAHFAEVFLDDVEVPVANRIGDEGGGWAIARTSLGHERATAFLADEFRYRKTVDEITRLVTTQGYAHDPHVRQELAKVETGLRIIAANASRALAALLRGEDPGAAGSVNRLVKSQFDQSMHGLALRVLGPAQVLGNRDESAPDHGKWTYGWLMTRASTIGAGTLEIQKNTVAEQVLGLPSSRGEETGGRRAKAVAGRPLATPPDDEVALREVLEKLLTTVATEDLLALEPGVGSRELWQQLGEIGVFGLAVAESSGGHGAGRAMLAAAGEEVARGLGPVPLASHLAALALLTAAGDPTGLVPALAAGKKVAAVAARRTDAGWAPAGVSFDGSVLTGSVPAVPGAAPWLDVLVVATDDGRAIVSESFSVQTRQPLDLTAIVGDVTFEGAPGVDVGGAELLAAAERDALLAVAADAVGVGARAVGEAVAYATARVQFGKPIGSFQAVSHRIADAYVAVEGARSLVAVAANALDAAAVDAALLVDLATAAALDAAVLASESSMQVHGGVGFTWEHGCHLLVRRARSDEALIARPTALRDRAAGALLGARVGAPLGA